MSTHDPSADKIPWRSLGRGTVAANVARGLLPVGFLPFNPVPFQEGVLPIIQNDDPNIERFLMEIVGTAIQADDGKLVTCAHVLDALSAQGRPPVQARPPMVLSRFMKDGMLVFVPERHRVKSIYYAIERLAGKSKGSTAS
jgi:hypothetical protein